MTPREHRTRKKKWRLYKQSVKRRQKELNTLQSPDFVPIVHESRQKQQAKKKRNKVESKFKRKLSVLHAATTTTGKEKS